MVNSKNPEDEVYGLVYNLKSSAEDKLDHNQGVPFAYTKENIAIDFWESKDGEAVDVSCHGIKKHALVYIDRKRVTDDHPKEVYIHRMNRGIKDALYGAGVPFAYVQKVIRPFIPEQGCTEVEDLAREQARNFEKGR